LAVTLLGQGKLKEGNQILEAALQASPSTLAMAGIQGRKSEGAFPL
jgi:hypothetical protein